MVYINECLVDVNTALKKFLQIYELFVKVPTVSKKFPTLASPRLYLDIFFQIYVVYNIRPKSGVRSLLANIRLGINTLTYSVTDKKGWS